MFSLQFVNAKKSFENSISQRTTWSTLIDKIQKEGQGHRHQALTQGLIVSLGRVTSFCFWVAAPSWLAGRHICIFIWHCPLTLGEQCRRCKHLGLHPLSTSGLCTETNTHSDPTDACVMVMLLLLLRCGDESEFSPSSQPTSQPSRPAAQHFYRGRGFK